MAWWAAGWPPETKKSLAFYPIPICSSPADRENPIVTGMEPAPIDVRRSIGPSIFSASIDTLSCAGLDIRRPRGRPVQVRGCFRHGTHGAGLHINKLRSVHFSSLVQPQQTPVVLPLTSQGGSIALYLDGSSMKLLGFREHTAETNTVRR